VHFLLKIVEKIDSNISYTK